MDQYQDSDNIEIIDPENLDENLKTEKSTDIDPQNDSMNSWTHQRSLKKFSTYILIIPALLVVAGVFYWFFIAGNDFDPIGMSSIIGRINQSEIGNTQSTSESNAVAAYCGQIAIINANLGTSVSSIADLMAVYDPDASNNQWVQNMASQMYIVKTAAEVAKQLDPPEVCKADHELYVQGLDKISLAMDSLASGLDNGNKDEITYAKTLMQSGAADIEKAVTDLDRINSNK